MTTVQNSTGSLRPSEIPREIRFNDDSLFSVVAYSILFLIAALGNTTVFVTLFRNRHRKSRVNLFIMHLAVADLLVTFIMMPTEIGWHVTVAWKAGGFGCRFFMFFRTFGFYLSSFILIAISLDRLIAIKHPMSLSDAGRRGRIMLLLAWLLSAVASIPQVSKRAAGPGRCDKIIVAPIISCWSYVPHFNGGFNKNSIEHGRVIISHSYIVMLSPPMSFLSHLGSVLCVWD